MNLDVSPFLEALAKQAQIYREKGIDMLKSPAISLPGLAVQWLFTEIDEGVKIPLVKGNDEDLYHTLKKGITGGAAIIFHR